jgi:hypothetical protein
MFINCSSRFLPGKTSTITDSILSVCRVHFTKQTLARLPLPAVCCVWRSTSALSAKVFRLRISASVPAKLKQYCLQTNEDLFELSTLQARRYGRSLSSSRLSLRHFNDHLHCASCAATGPIDRLHRVQPADPPVAAVGRQVADRN